MGRNHAGLAAFIRRHPLSAFFLWFFTVGQAFAFAPLYLDVDIPVQWFINASTLIGLLLPTVVITRIVDGGDGVRKLGRRITKVRVPAGMYAIAVLAVPVLATAIAVALVGTPDVPGSTLITALGSLFVVNTVVGFALNNLWEEVAWMGLVQARLQVRHGPMLAAVITARCSSCSTSPCSSRTGLVVSAIIVVGFSVLTIPFRAFIGWLYNATGGSLLLVGLAHAAGNAVAVGAGFSQGSLRVLYPDSTDLVGVLHQVAFAIVGLVVIVATRGRLGGGRRRASVRRTPRAATVAGG